MNDLKLTLEDLNNLIAVIDRGSQRGIFAGAELSAIGALYMKLAQIAAQTADKEGQQ
jgi:hypothetical protein